MKTNKRLFVFILFVLTTMSIHAQQKSISYIKDDGSWYQVYDENGKNMTTVSKSTVGEIVGWGHDFFVSVDGSWCKIYDLKGKLLKTLSKQTVGEVVAVSSTTFTSRDGSWLKTYDKSGKLIHTRSAR